MITELPFGDHTYWCPRCEVRHDPGADDPCPNDREAVYRALVEAVGMLEGPPSLVPGSPRVVWFADAQRHLGQLMWLDAIAKCGRELGIG